MAMLEQESFKFIKENLDISFDEIPLEFVNYWAVERHDKIMDGTFELEENDHRFRIFLYAYVLIMHGTENTDQLELDDEEIFQTFIIFQTLLAIRIIHETTDMTFQKFKIFDFKNYGSMKILGNPNSK